MKKLIQILGCLGAVAILAPAATINNVSGSMGNTLSGVGASAATGAIGTTVIQGYASFDLTGQSGTISNVTLSLPNPAGATLPGGTWSATLTVYNLATAIGSITYTNTGNPIVVALASGIFQGAIDAAPGPGKTLQLTLGFSNPIGTADHLAFNYDSTTSWALNFDLNAGNQGGGGNQGGVPEPSTIALMGTALAGLGLARRRK